MLSVGRGASWVPEMVSGQCKLSEQQGNDMLPDLPDGEYPFIHERYPLSELAMIEAPPDLERLFRAEAARNSVQLARGVPVELKCQSKEFPDAVFLIYWPLDDDRIHMLAPREYAQNPA